MFITFFFSSLHYCTKGQEKQGKEAFFSVFNLSVTSQPPALKPWNLKPLPQNWGKVISDEFCWICNMDFPPFLSTYPPSLLLPHSFALISPSSPSVPLSLGNLTVQQPEAPSPLVPGEENPHEAWVWDDGRREREAVEVEDRAGDVVRVCRRVHSHVGQGVGSQPHVREGQLNFHTHRRLEMGGGKRSTRVLSGV